MLAVVEIFFFYRGRSGGVVLGCRIVRSRALYLGIVREASGMMLLVWVALLPRRWVKSMLVEDDAGSQFGVVVGKVS